MKKNEIAIKIIEAIIEDLDRYRTELQNIYHPCYSTINKTKSTTDFIEQIKDNIEVDLSENTPIIDSVSETLGEDVVKMLDQIFLMENDSEENN